MKTETILKYIIYTGIFLLILVPFVVADGGASASLFYFPSMYFPFITGKAFFFRIVTEIVFIAWVILALRDYSYRPRNSWLARTIGVFLLVIFIADCFSVNPFKSFWSNFERMEGYVTLIHLGALFFVAGTVLQTQKMWNYFFNSSLVASVILSIYGFMQLAGTLPIHQGAGRLDATLGNSAYFAVYMIFHIFLALFLLLGFIKKYHKTAKWNVWVPILYGIVAVVDSVALYYTATRGAQIGAVVGLLFILAGLAWKEKEQKSVRTVASVLLGIMVVLGIAFYAGKNTDFVKSSPVLSRFSSLLTTDFSKIARGEAKSRFTIWPMAWAGVNSGPRALFGWGQENFNYLFYTHYSPEMYDQEAWFDRAHNVFLDWLVAGGWFGLLAYLSMFAASFYYIWKKNLIFSLPERLVLTGLLIAYFIHNIFVFDQLVSYLYFFFVMAFLHALHVQEHDGPVLIWFKENRESIEQVGTPVACVMLFVIIWFFNWNGFLQATTLADSLTQQPEGVTKNIELIKSAVNRGAMGTYESRERLSEMAMQISGVAIDPAIKTEMFTLAFSELKKQLEETPEDVRYYYFMTTFLSSYKRFGEALPYIQKGIGLSPKKQILLMQEGSTYLNLGNVKDGLASFKKAYELEPNYLEARMLYALSAVYAGDEELQKQLLVPVYGTSIISDQRFLNAYIATGHADRAIKALLTMLQQNPGNVDIRVTLASIYLRLGDKVNASDQIKKAIKEHPEFEAQGKGYLQQIKDFQLGK